MPQFTWITFAQARAQLASRLADPSNIFWTDAECGLYIIEALRTWSALTEMWNADFTFTADSSAQWYNLGTMANSPRLRTVTDSDIYTVIQYHLLEPPTGGGGWTGTSQYTLADLQYALQRRRDEVIQTSSSNLAAVTLPVNPGGRRIYFPDTVLEARRAHYVPATGGGYTLNLEDMAAMQYFENDYPNQMAGIPETWSVVSGPPLAMDVDVPPLPGNFAFIVLQSGPAFAPPATTLMSMPDDWTWVAKWGALSDLLGRESEATDRIRADYCLKRYMDGLKIMGQANWISAAVINNKTCDIPSIAEIDCYTPDWETDATTWPMVVSAGFDLLAPAPVQTGTGILGVELTVNGNAPIPSADTDYVQASRDVFDPILDYAQHLAAFKMGGQEFILTQELFGNFMNAAAAQNKRLTQLGLYYDTLHIQGTRQDITQPKQ